MTLAQPAVTLTALSSSDRQEPWDKPLDHANIRTQAKTFLAEDMSVMPSPSRPAVPIYSHSASRSQTSLRKSSDSHSKQSLSSDPHLQPQRLNVLTRKDSNLSAVGSEPDSLLDLYGTRPSKKSIEVDETGNFVFTEEDERSRWIHRDKLLRIESQELQQAGIYIGRDSRTTSRAASRQTSAYGLRDHSEPPKTLQTYTIVDEDDEPISFELRRPEEVALDYEEMRTPMRPLKPGASKLPLHKSSPIPVPMDYLERPNPLHWPTDEEVAAMQVNDSPSRSTGSQVVDDEPTTPTFPPSSQESPSKPKTNGARRPSEKSTASPASRGRTKSIAKSNTSQRPGTSKGESRPEGDPPWLHSIYSPDPMLPPEQQMLPTVAKRLQQKQWEQQGAFANTYDRDLQPVKVLPDSEINAPVRQTVTVTKHPDEGEWPLKSPMSDTGSVRPGTSGTSGGYKTMPTVAPEAKSKTPEPLRMQDPEDDDAKKGAKCACCIIM